MKLKTAFVLGVMLFGAGCARAPLQNRTEALRPVSPPSLADDLPLDPLFQAIETEIKLLETSPNHSTFVFGADTFTKQEYLDGLKRLISAGRGAKDKIEFFNVLQNEFQFYQVYGQGKWGDAFFTSYYEPVVKGSLKKTKQFSQPLYRQPGDLIALDLSNFDEKFAGERKLRGRIEYPAKAEKLSASTPPLAGPIPKLVPYYSRAEIDGETQKLNGKKLELVWLDPFDAYLLEVQGSGTVELPNGKKMRVGYSEKNGQKYESLSKFLKDKIKPEDMNLHSIEAYLRGLPEIEMRRILNLNPSYVFFRELDEHALTSLGVPATEGRTIAVDQRFFPKGALAFLVATKPVFEHEQALQPKSYEPFSRFVLDQDVGGAILGGGRADIFWGRGNSAKRAAGVIKQSGNLYYIAPKKKAPKG